LEAAGFEPGMKPLEGHPRSFSRIWRCGLLRQESHLLNRGVFWLIVTPGLWIGSGGVLGWICHVVAAFTAHSRARKKNASRVLVP